MIVSGLDFEVYEDASSPASPSESASFDGSRSSRSFWFENASPVRRHQFKKAFLGSSQLQGDGTRQWLGRTIPTGDGGTMVVDDDFNPFGLPYLWCKSIPNGTPLGKPESIDATASVTYSAYRFSCEFRSVPYRVSPDDAVGLIAAAGPLVPGAGDPAMPDEGDALRRGYFNTRYIQKRVQENVKINQIKAGGLFFDLPSGFASNRSVGQPLPLPIYTEKLTYTWFEVPEDCVPWKAIATCANGVNDAYFDTYPIGTLLLKASSRRVYNRPLGPGLMYDLEYQMEYLPNRMRIAPFTELGWNSTPAILKPPDWHGFDFYMVSDGLGRRPHHAADFASLFRPDQP